MHTQVMDKNTCINNNFNMSISSKGSLDSSVDKESTCNAGYPGLIPWLGRSAAEGIGSDILGLALWLSW